MHFGSYVSLPGGTLLVAQLVEALRQIRKFVGSIPDDVIGIFP
jgi:hypothetical protein